MFLLHLLLFFHLGNFNSFAQDSCPEEQKKDRDMRSEFGPLRNQDTIGWCFSYATTDLVSHWIYKTHYPKAKNPGQYDTRKKENMISAAWGTSIYFGGERRRNHIRNMRLFGDKEKGAVTLYQELMQKRKVLYEDLRQTALKSKFKKQGDIMYKLASVAEQREKSSGKAYNLLAEQTDELISRLDQIDEHDPEITKALVQVNDNSRETEEIGKIISAIKNKSDLEGGDIDDFYHLLVEKQSGFCRESEIPSDDLQIPKFFGKKSDTNDLMSQVYRFLSLDSLTDTNSVTYKKRLACAVSASSVLFPKLKPGQIGDILSKYKDFDDPIYNMAKASCKNKLVIDEDIATPELVYIERPDLNNYADIKTLIKDGIPVEIGYDGNRALLPKKAVDNAEDGRHASIIVGQKYDCEKKEMNFIMRDSVGGAEGCNHFLELHKKHDSIAPFTCDNGHYVIPQSKLGKYIEKAYAIKSKESQ